MAAKRNSSTIPQDGKHIRYDRETRDYACYLNGEFIGYAPNYSDGETLCEQTYYAQLSHTSAPAPEAAPVEVTHKDVDWVEYRAGRVALSVEDNRPACLCLFGTGHDLRPGDLADLRSLYTLLSSPVVQQQLASAPAAAVEVTPVYRQANGDLSWEAGVEVASFDYAVGEGLTRALIGTHTGDKEGIELIIGGNPINERIEEVITLADVRQLRDNLTALLAEPRVQTCQLAARAV